MRKIFLPLLITGILFVFVAPIKAQLTLTLSNNIDTQPIWGPVGYDEVQYYYFPDINSYYNVSEKRFHFYDEGKWTNGSSLPLRYNNFDLYKSYKVVINEHEPWKKHNVHKKKYSSFKGRHDQIVIRDSRDTKYFVIKDHPEHGKWEKNQKDNNGNEHNRKNKNEGHEKNKKWILKNSFGEKKLFRQYLRVWIK